MKRIDVIPGDIAKENFGLGNDQWDALTRRINTIFHSAASINFNLSLEEARSINTNGTAQILDFADHCHNLDRLIYISTAYVAGMTTNKFYESDLIAGQDFANTYEETKYEAELLIRQSIEKGMPIIVFRPSVISGDFQTGEIVRGNIIFEIIKKLYDLKFNEFICDDDSSLNIIPINYVIDSIVYISKSKSNEGKTFNITNSCNANIKNIIIKCCQALNIDVPIFIPIDRQNTASKLTRRQLYTFVNYIENSHVFDDSLTKQALKSSDVVCPIITDDYWERIVSYCIDQKLFD